MKQARCRLQPAAAPTQFDWPHLVSASAGAGRVAPDRAPRPRPSTPAEPGGEVYRYINSGKIWCGKKYVIYFCCRQHLPGTDSKGLIWVANKIITGNVAEVSIVRRFTVSIVFCYEVSVVHRSEVSMMRRSEVSVVHCAEVSIVRRSKVLIVQRSEVSIMRHSAVSVEHRSEVSIVRRSDFSSRISRGTDHDMLELPRVQTKH